VTAFDIAIFVVLGATTIFVLVLFGLEERDLRRTYELFGTTGFLYVDERMRRIYGRGVESAALPTNRPTR
jgi:hypothetical protein